MSLQKINSHSLKISAAKVEIPNSLPIGTYGVKVLVTGDIVKEERLDNQDGTVDMVYILRAENVEVQ